MCTFRRACIGVTSLSRLSDDTIVSSRTDSVGPACLSVSASFPPRAVWLLTFLVMDETDSMG